MKTLNGMIAGSALVALASAFQGCAPTMVASHPHPVIYTPAPAPAPVQTVMVPAPVVPVVPVWAPPYAYVTEVHYYYFPDYMVYYDVFAANYCYFNGYSWLHVTVLPTIPMYYGFSPYNSYLVVLNRYTTDPWMRNTYYQEQYPSGYYQTAYTPRTRLSSDTRLRAYDENQGRPLYVDQRSNREVKVQYTETPRTAVSNNSGERRSTLDSRTNSNQNLRTEEAAGNRGNIKGNVSDVRSNVRQDTRTSESTNNRDRMQQAPATNTGERMPAHEVKQPERSDARRETVPARAESQRSNESRNAEVRHQQETRNANVRTEERNAERSESRNNTVTTNSRSRTEAVRTDNAVKNNESAAGSRSESQRTSDSRENGRSKKSR